jgi:hypothetical protein
MKVPISKISQRPGRLDLVHALAPFGIPRVRGRKPEVLEAGANVMLHAMLESRTPSSEVTKIEALAYCRPIELFGQYATPL